ncbi:FtsX-like permease family protein [Paenibacillus sp.]|jgi:putative ABC transport system permease protein|uniref:ABC transporter permease n=1 Tax=Paenibacillus sp. TaxID=58172 RepID=UPI002821293E|nr:FtsX-like permease family protein [Paenibacillus sp.]MDR0268644.1 FtsX-like permease family protein [Paenibacillus sp.]
MYAVWKLSWKNLKNKKVQNSFIAIIIMLAALLLSTAIFVITNTNRVYENMHGEVNGAHQILQMENSIYDPVRVQQWWAKQDGVTTSELMRYRYLSSMSHGGEEIPNVDLFMMDTPNGPFPVDKLLFVQGEERQTPEPGTAWIPTSIAYSNHIQVGDQVEFKTDQGVFQLKVAAVVVDISYCSPFATSGRIWLSHQDYGANLSTLQGNDHYMVGLRFDDYSHNRAYWEKFEQFLGTPYLESVKDFESLSSYYMIANQVIGFVMIFLAVVMISVALYTLGFTISDAILSSYRTIGIIKSVGLSSRNVIMAYVTQYTLLAVVSVIPGIWVSHIFAGKLVDSSMANLRTGASQMNSSYSMGIWLGVLVIAVIFLSALIFSYKARSVEPAQAVRYGMSEKQYSQKSGRKKRLFQLGTLPTSLVIGLKGVTKNIRGSVLIIIISALSTAVLVFGFLFVYSISSIHGTIAKWGYDSADLSVRIDNPDKLTYEQFHKEVLLDPRVKNYSRYGDANAVLPINGELAAERKQDTMGVLLTVAEGDFDEIGYENVKGRNPVSDSEISIGVNISRSLGVDVGDRLDIYIEGEKRTLTVTGVYQAIANMAYTGRITADAVRAVNPDYGASMNTMFINLQNGTSVDQFVNELHQKYGSSIWTASQATLVDEVFSQAFTIIVLPMSVMAMLFIVITFVIIYSICRINMKKESRTYGIYKSVGMTSRQIRLSETTGILVLSAIGSLVGVPLGLTGLPPLLNFILTNYGIVKVPLVMNGGGIAIMIPLSIAAACLGSWFASKSVQTTSPRLLTIE